MIRLLCTLSVLATSCGVVAGVGTVARSAAEPVVIGRDEPVFLGQMVVKATALPER